MDELKLIRLLNSWSHCLKILVAHNDSPDYVKEQAKFVGTTVEIIEHCKSYTGNFLIIYVAGPPKIVYGLKQVLPNATIWHIDDEQNT